MPADQGLDHVGPVFSHCGDKLKHIEVLFHLHPLQHGVQTDVRARATNASTGMKGEGRENEGLMRLIGLCSQGHTYWEPHN